MKKSLKNVGIWLAGIVGTYILTSLLKAAQASMSIPEALAWVGTTAVNIGKQPVPTWVVLLCFAGLVAWRRFARWYRQASRRPWVDGFRSMNFQGVTWRWSWEMNEETGKYRLATLRARCPDCRMLLKQVYLGDSWTLHCDHCDIGLTTYQDYDELTDSVRREIDRRLVTGEWKKHQHEEHSSTHDDEQTVGQGSGADA